MFVLCTILGYVGIMALIFYGEPAYKGVKNLLSGPKYKNGLPMLWENLASIGELKSEISDKMLLEYIEENELFEEAAKNIKSKKYLAGKLKSNKELIYEAYWDTVSDHQELKKKMELEDTIEQLEYRNQLYKEMREK